MSRKPYNRTYALYKAIREINNDIEAETAESSEPIDSVVAAAIVKRDKLEQKLERRTKQKKSRKRHQNNQSDSD